MNCIVIDDDANIRLLLKSLIEEVSFLEWKAEFENPVQAIDYLKSEVVDLLFLDVEMPKMNGMEFLESLSPRPLTIICTSKKEYAVQSYELQAIDYLVKPVSDKRFFAAVSKAREWFNSKSKVENTNEEFIFIKDNSVITKIRFDQLLYIQAMGDYMKLFIPDRFYILHSTMKALEEALPQKYFFRIHRSFIVNLHHLDKIEDNTAYVRGVSLIIGDSYRQALLKRLNYL